MKRKIDPKKEQELLFNIVVPVFNSEKYIEKCLNSIVKQSHQRFQVQVVDDCSSDSSYEIANSICEKNKNFKLFRNPRRIGALNNIFNLLYTKIEEPSKTIDVIIDGDDYLYSSDVLNIIEEKYIKTNCLITYGSHISSKGVLGKKYPKIIRKLNLFRKDVNDFFPDTKFKKMRTAEYIYSFFPNSFDNSNYKKHCISCHGKARQGRYEHETMGDDFYPSLVGLTKTKKLDSFNTFEKIKKIHQFKL